MTGHCNATDQCSTSSSSVFLFFVQNFVNKKIMSAAHSKGLGFCMHALERERERNGKNLYRLEQIILIIRIYKITTTENPNSKNPI